MTLGELLKLALDWVWGLWPLRIVHAWESGVRIWLGRPVALLGAGIHWYVPLLGSLEVECTNTMTGETEFQTHTVGEETVSWTMGIRYHIHNAQLLYEQIHDYDSTIENEVLRVAGGIVEEFGETDWALVDEVRNDLCARVHEQAGEVLSEWGVTLEAVSLITCCTAPVVRVLQG